MNQQILLVPQASSKRIAAVLNLRWCGFWFLVAWIGHDFANSVCGAPWQSEKEKATSSASLEARAVPNDVANKSEPADGEQKVRAAVERLRAALVKTRVALVSYLIGQSDDSEIHNSEHQAALAEGRTAKRELLDLAYPFLLQSTQLNDEMMELARMMMFGLYDDFQYERSYRLANHLKKLAPHPDVDLLIMRSALLTNRFEIAAEYREKVAAQIQKLPELEISMLKTLPDLIRIGTEERKLRMAEEDDNLPRVQFVTTEGTFVVELFENQYPETVGHFVYLVEKKFYDQMIFHRVTKNFLPFSIAQTGLVSMRDVPGSQHKAWFTHDIEYKIVDEKPKDGAVRRHLRGVISLAVKSKDNKPVPNTGGSEFMIALTPAPALDGIQVAFGRVVEGLDVIDRFAPNVTVSEKDGSEKPIENASFSTILEAKVLRKRDHEYLPNKVKKQ